MVICQVISYLPFLPNRYTDLSSCISVTHVTKCAWQVKATKQSKRPTDVLTNPLSDYPCDHGPLARYAKLRVAHAPGMPGTFSPPPLVSDPDTHHGTCVTHVPWCMPGSLSSGFLWSRWRGKRSRHSRCMRNAQIYVSGKRPIAILKTFQSPSSSWNHRKMTNKPVGCI